MGSVTSTIKAKSGHVYVYETTVTPSGGNISEDIKITVSLALLNFNADLRQVIVKSTTSTTTFNFGIFTKSDDFPVWTKSGNTGYFNDASKLLACMVGEVYLRIYDASLDEAIKIKLIYKE